MDMLVRIFDLQPEFTWMGRKSEHAQFKVFSWVRFREFFVNGANRAVEMAKPLCIESLKHATSPRASCDLRSSRPNLP
jgi:hypothetical protein